MAHPPCAAAAAIAPPGELARPASARWPGTVRVAMLAAIAALACADRLHAEPAPPGAATADAAREALGAEVRQLVEQAAKLAWPASAQPPRIEIVVGQLDPRLRLAPCQRIAPYLPAGSRPLGATRVGLRCVQGQTAWNVYLPITVKLLAPSLVANAALPAGTVLEARHLAEAEVDLAASASPAIGQLDLALGRTLGHGLAAGQALRRSDLKLRQWFNAGDTVRVVAAGEGFAISGQAQALDAGIEGQRVRARTESGQVVSGMATAANQLAIAL